ncbi:HDL040Cp [Eremothecium sinecaudum]|uniref:HDL040Cp n=1 Tax=Eremothecium sinecaudum TaxID=45286 RepID=A0A0X8HSM3_9SACH|nr:HDL040Cp [Eremothecium sinecaudum]AMD20704.1 HDL040Cp [Eremothecium sinecaudum]
MSNSLKSTTKKRKRQLGAKPSNRTNDEDITDISSNEEVNSSEDELNMDDNNEAEIDSDEEFETENAADKRRRLAKQYLENLKTEANDIMESSENTLTRENQSIEVDNYNNFDAKDLDRDIIASRLKNDVAEQHGRVYRWISDKLLLSEAKTSFTRVGEKNLTSISCYQPGINKFSDSIAQNKNKAKIFAYTVSKDMQLTKYDVTDFAARPKRLKYTRGSRNYYKSGQHEYENTTEGHYDEILTVSASPDGKYVVTGGRDRKLIVWSTESLTPVKVIPTKDRKGEVLALAYRKNSDQLYAACADYKIRTYAINQFAQLEVLYGHQDLVVDLSALNMERCVTVGSRDRSAILWKIADETRLTFRGGDDPEKLLRKWLKENVDQEKEQPVFCGEGSIDCVTMVDDSHFITGSDNGNIALWSLSRKKPIFIYRAAHGIIPLPKENKISAESDTSLCAEQLQGTKLMKPYWITSLYAIPYSNVFFSGSWNGSLKVWALSENMRDFKLISELQNCKGLVTKIQVVEAGKHQKETFRVLASVSKEHRLGRWVDEIPNARNGIYSAVIEQSTF